MKKLRNFIFLLLIFLIPTQFGRHFWPNWSLVNGVRIDYLSPTLYITDILIVLLFLFSFFRRDKSDDLSFGMVVRPSPTLIIIFLLLVVLFSNFSFISFFKFLKIFEIFVFAWIIKTNLTKKNFSQFIFVLSLSMLFQSFLGIAQFFNHGSINGIFWFFGERNFSSGTPGIANAVINGTLILRPYGTLSHPNVLAGYLLVGLVIVQDHIFNSLRGNSKFEILNSKQIQNTNQKIKQFSNLTIQQWFFVFVVIISSLALLLTMSRVAILLWLFFFLLFFFKFQISNFKFKTRVFLYSCILVFVLVLLSPRFFSIFGENKESYIKRIEQSQIAILMIKDHPLFGVGLNQYLVELPKYIKGAEFRDYQPAHNVFLLILAETGIVGFLLTFLFLIQFSILNFKFSIKFLNSKFKFINFSSCLRVFLYSCILVLSLSDHYFYTTQQGNLMIGLILGLTNLKFKNQNSK